MTVRGKFYVKAITLTPHNDGGRVELEAVSRGSRNADWASATPSGSISMYVSNPAAFAFFENVLRLRDGQKHPEVFVDFTVSTDGVFGDGHAFVANDLPETHYQHGKCAECGDAPENHPG